MSFAAILPGGRYVTFQIFGVSHNSITILRLNTGKAERVNQCVTKAMKSMLRGLDP